MPNELTPSHLEEICRAAYVKRGTTEHFARDKDKIIKILTKADGSENDFLSGKKTIGGLQSLSSNICGKVNTMESRPISIDRTRDEIKASIALFLDPTKIDILVNLLNNIDDLVTWSPSIFDKITRKQVRDKDSKNDIVLKRDFSEEEIKEIIALKVWIRKNIRYHDDETGKSKIDWERIKSELLIKGYIKYANKFEIQDISNNLNKQKNSN